ncbi:MAG TPA: histidine kinase dimerization/phospho-acceptor domain-containing protein, partial [Vicinamibacterales bacterium]|nr:histidine kinase dimerization/phospho-acceptor domain-containing protein [Vicinamibacterales bacterium]
MRLLASLRGRIFLASALLAVLTCGVALFVVNRRVTNEGERSIQREILVSGAIIDQLRTTRTETYTITARLIADSPTLKAAVTTDAATVQKLIQSYGPALNSANLLLVTDAGGAAMATSGDDASAAGLLAGQPAVKNALAGRETVSLLARPNGILQVVTVPISVGLTQPQILGTLSAGFLMNDALVAQLKEITGSDVAFRMNGRVLATTLSKDTDAALASNDYAVLERPMGPPDTRAVALILRSRAEQLQSVRAIQTALAVTAIVAVALAILLSFAVASTVTRPLAGITGVMREMATTGDLTRKITLGEGRLWRDEDAELLATTFNTLTESVARFQREMSQRERLLSLGRLSTVIAHEVRNPLMIIKGSLHALRQKDLTDTAMREVAHDIDEEVERLNRIVNEVLDFARPIKFDLAATDLNALCRDSAAASQAAGPGGAVALDLDPAAGAVMTDAERLRIALVNMLVNARHAGGDVTLSTRMNGEHVNIVIADTGRGIDPEHLSHV